ncbi:MAG: EamA family transporter [Planctomycetales bacterium]|nr:EamA family transporter [Planctomycetales bacterium]
MAASVTFVLGMMFASKAINRGATPWTGTFYANLLLGVIWCCIGAVHGDIIPVRQWPGAIVIGVVFVLGQLLTYFAYRFGDVSVATPIFGVKILFVAVLSSIVNQVPVPAVIWAAAVVASCGVALVQWRPRSASAHGNGKPVGRAVVLALSAAMTLSVFDILLQRWGKPSGTVRFLPVVFTAAALSSCVMLPWTNRFSTLVHIQALRPMLIGSFLMCAQAMGMCIALSGFGEATEINIVYSLRGVWGVGLAWALAHFFEGGEQYAPRIVIICRAAGAALVTAAVVTALL